MRTATTRCATGAWATTALLAGVTTPASACNGYNSSCNNPQLGIVGQVAIVLFVLVIVSGLIWWRLGRTGPITGFLLWRTNRRVQRAGRRARSNSERSDRRWP